MTIGFASIDHVLNIPAIEYVYTHNYFFLFLFEFLPCFRFFQIWRINFVRLNEYAHWFLWTFSFPVSHCFNCPFSSLSTYSAFKNAFIIILFFLFVYSLLYINKMILFRTTKKLIDAARERIYFVRVSTVVFAFFLLGNSYVYSETKKNMFETSVSCLFLYFELKKGPKPRREIWFYIIMSFKVYYCHCINWVISIDVKMKVLNIENFPRFLRPMSLYFFLSWCLLCMNFFVFL